MLLGPTDLFESGEDISVCLIYWQELEKRSFYVFLGNHRNVCQRDEYFFYFFRNCCKIIIKDI